MRGAENYQLKHKINTNLLANKSGSVHVENLKQPSREQHQIAASSHLNYYNTPCVGVIQASFSRLQLVQNPAARLLTGTGKQEHISHLMTSLHWLPVHFTLILRFYCLSTNH